MRTRAEAADEDSPRVLGGAFKVTGGVTPVTITTVFYVGFNLTR